MGVLGFPSQDDFDQFRNEVMRLVADISSQVRNTTNESAEEAEEAIARISTLEQGAIGTAERLKQILMAA